MPVANKTSTLGEILLRDGIISPSQLRKAQQAQKQSSHSMGRVLVDMGLIDEGQRMSILRKAFGFEILNLANIKTDPLVCSLIPSTFATKHNILPVRRDESNTLIVAMEDPSDMIVIDAIRNQTGMGVRAYIAQSQELAQAIQIAYAAVSAQPIDAATPGAVIPKHVRLPRGKLYRIARSWAFPLMMIFPLAAFFLSAWLIDPFQQALFNMAQGNFFDITLYGVLGWMLWAIILFELNGIVFKPDEAEEE